MTTGSAYRCIEAEIKPLESDPDTSFNDRVLIKVVRSLMRRVDELEREVGLPKKDVDK